MSCEGERVGEIPVLMIVGPRGQKLHELGTSCPEYPELRPEYPGRVLQFSQYISVLVLVATATFADTNDCRG